MYYSCGRGSVLRHLLAIIFLYNIGFVYSQSETSSVRIALFNIRELSTDKLKMIDSDGQGSKPGRGSAWEGRWIHEDQRTTRQSLFDQYHLPDG